MIVFDVKCRNEHVFEGWFRDSAAFDDQSKAGKVVCPICGNRKVKKALMAPNIASRKEKSSAEQEIVAARAMQLLYSMREQVEKNCEHVGEKFAEEARKIHYGETAQRNIYGEATPEDAEELREEGIEFGQIPWLPRHDG